MLLDGQHLFNYQMNDRLQELTVFVRVGESGSFTRAARDMNLSQPSVSRIVGELEVRLGVKLLLRTTRRLTLTAAGEKFLDRARAVLRIWKSTTTPSRCTTRARSRRPKSGHEIGPMRAKQVRDPPASSIPWAEFDSPSARLQSRRLRPAGTPPPPLPAPRHFLSPSSPNASPPR